MTHCHWLVADVSSVNVIDIPPPPASLLLGARASAIIQLDCLLIITRNNANQGGQTGPQTGL